LGFFVALASIAHFQVFIMHPFLGEEYIPTWLPLIGRSSVPIVASVRDKLLVNSVLVSCFFLQHSLMARGRFKDWMNKGSNKYHFYEKGAYQTASGLALFTLMFLYQGTFDNIMPPFSP
jgi:hypothetical protein